MASTFVYLSECYQSFSHWLAQESKGLEASLNMYVP